jgi:hypothetical protein
MVLILAASLLSGCSILDKFKKEEPVTEDEGQAVEEIAIQEVTDVSSDVSDDIYAIDDEDVKISPLAWIYESEAGVQLTSPLDFRDTTNTSTSFQLEHNSPDLTMMVRVEQTEFKPVDLDRLSTDETLFVRNIIPKNISRQDSKFTVNADHMYMTYTVSQGDAKIYCSVFLVNTGYEIFKVITERSDDFEITMPLTVGRVKPQPSEDYELRVDEVVRVQVRDMAFSIPKGKDSKWALREEDRLLSIVSPTSDLSVYLMEGKTEADIPVPDSFKSMLGTGDWETVISEEGYDYLFTSSADRVFRVVCHLNENGDLYVFASHNVPLYRYLNTIRRADEASIITLVNLGDVFERAASQGTVLEHRKPIGELSIDVTESEWPIEQVYDSWQIKIKEDNWVNVYACNYDISTANVKSADPTIQTVKQNGDHFIATTTDNLAMYFKQYVIDGKRWMVSAMGTDGFAIAKTVKQREGYKYLQGYAEDHFSFGKATFPAPLGTVEVEDSFPLEYKLPDNKGKLVFELIDKDNKDYFVEDSEWVGGFCFTAADRMYTEIKIDKEYRVFAEGELAKEMLYALRVGK